MNYPDYPIRVMLCIYRAKRYMLLLCLLLTANVGQASKTVRLTPINWETKELSLSVNGNPFVSDTIVVKAITECSNAFVNHNTMILKDNGYLNLSLKYRYIITKLSISAKCNKTATDLTLETENEKVSNTISSNEYSNYDFYLEDLSTASIKLSSTKTCIIESVTITYDECLFYPTLTDSSKWSNDAVSIKLCKGEYIDKLKLHENDILEFSAKEGYWIKSVTLRATATIDTSFVAYGTTLTSTNDSVEPDSNLKFAEGSYWLTFSGLNYRYMPLLYLQAKRFRNLSSVEIEYVRIHSYTLSIPSDTLTKGSSTLFLNYPVEVPQGCQAFYASSFEDNVLNFTNCHGKIAANQGVVLSVNSGQSYTFTETNDIVSAPSTNYMKGYILDQPTRNFDIDDGWYYITKNTQVKKISDSVSLKANKAYIYLPQPTGGSTKNIQISMDGESTSVVQVQPSNTPDALAYDLMGNLTGSAYKGIVIINGKKVLRR